MRFSVEKIGTIPAGQDGDIYGDFIFRFDEKGNCTVVSLKTLAPIATFTLGGTDRIVPHSNAVCFGAEKYAEEDEFPLLYTNVYNTYQHSEEKHEGECCVYRLVRHGSAFFARLVQIIRIGFTKAAGLWRSGEGEDIRPYGNFVVDRENRRLYVFTMLDHEQVTRFFSFALPPVTCCAEENGSETVVLEKEDILRRFDCPYVHFMQGAIFHDGKIISSEGFANSVENPPALRVFDVNAGAQLLQVELTACGLTADPEFVSVAGGKIYYSDAHGTLYTVHFGL